MAEHVREVIDKLSVEQITRLRSLLLSTPTPRDLMMWRVRPYCGHVVEWTAHRTHTLLSVPRFPLVARPTCGLDPASILAAVPVGLSSALRAPSFTGVIAAPSAVPLISARRCRLIC